MEDAKIVNIVASASIGEVFNLETISKALRIIVPKKRQFPGLVYKLEEPKCTVLIFGTGKIICTGTRCQEDVRKVVKIMVHKLINILAKRIENANIPINRNPRITIENIVATFNLGVELNLNSIALNFGLEEVEYEPEQFPGMVYRLKKPKVVALLFGTGKIVITGAKNENQIKLAINKIKKELNDIGYLKMEE